MTAKILQFGGITFGRIEPDKVLEANKGKFKEVFLIGLDENSDDYYASSTGDLPTLLWMLERAKKELLDSK